MFLTPQGMRVETGYCITDLDIALTTELSICYSRLETGIDAKMSSEFLTALIDYVRDTENVGNN